MPTNEQPRIWNPQTDTFIAEVPNAYLYDCVASAGTATGSIVMAGGGCGECFAQDHTFIFAPFAGSYGTWRPTGALNKKRWYASLCTLADGRLLASGGLETCVDGCQDTPPHCDGDFVMVPSLEIYNPQTGQWSEDGLANADLPEPPFFPFVFVLPGSQSQTKLFFAGPAYKTLTLDLGSSSPAWEAAGNSDPVWGKHGSAAMPRPGVVVKCGGFTEECFVPLDTAAMIDFTASGTPDWEPLSVMPEPRKDHNLALTPDGFVLMVGGSNSCDPGPADDLCEGCEPVMLARRFDPDNPEDGWTQMAAMTHPRGYHSTAALLGDGRVLSGGGENSSFKTFQQNSSRSHELYEPWYMFDSSDDFAPRPNINTAPGEAIYGGTITVTTHPVAGAPMTLALAKASLIRLPAVTHGFDQNQRFMSLTINSIQGTEQLGYTLEINAPQDASYAPPGYYMLFLLSNSGVPSVARYLRIDCWYAADINQDGDINSIDLGILLSNWSIPATAPGCGGAVWCPSDLNGDGLVNSLDLGILLAAWGDYQACDESSQSMGGGESMMMAGGEVEGPPPPDQQTIDWALQADIVELWAWYLGMTGGPPSIDE